MAPAPAPEIPRVIGPADDLDVICEQIEAMLNHVADAPDNCACYECARYLAVRAIMFQVFK